MHTPARPQRLSCLPALSFSAASSCNVRSASGGPSARVALASSQAEETRWKILGGGVRARSEESVSRRDGC